MLGVDECELSVQRRLSRRRLGRRQTGQLAATTKQRHSSGSTVCQSNSNKTPPAPAPHRGKESVGREGGEESEACEADDSSSMGRRKQFCPQKSGASEANGGGKCGKLNRNSPFTTDRCSMSPLQLLLRRDCGAAWWWEAGSAARRRSASQTRSFVH